MKLRGLRWLLSLPASMFFCLTASVLYETQRSPSGLAALLALLPGAFLASSVALWVLADARKRHRAVPYDFGFFVFIAWPVLVPIYLFSTRGWRAFAPLGFFMLLYLAAMLLGSVTILISSMR